MPIKGMGGKETHLYHATLPPQVLYADAEVQAAIAQGYSTEYIPREYPKMINLAGGRQVRVENAEEEAEVILANTPAPPADTHGPIDSEIVTKANSSSRDRKGEVVGMEFKPAKGGLVSETRTKFKRGGQGGGPLEDYEQWLEKVTYADGSEATGRGIPSVSPDGAAEVKREVVV